MVYAGGISFSPNSTQVTLSNGPIVEIWDIASEAKVRTLDPLEPAVFPTQLSYADNGKLVYAILNRNSDAVVWDAVNGKFIRRLDLPHRNPNAFSAVALYKNWFARNNYDDFWSFDRVMGPGTGKDG